MNNKLQTHHRKTSRKNCEVFIDATVSSQQEESHLSSLCIHIVYICMSTHTDIRVHTTAQGPLHKPLTTSMSSGQIR